MIQVTGDIDGFRRQLRQELARLDREISKNYYDWTKTVFATLVKGGAQWSGNLVSNFNYSVGGPDYSYEPIPNKTGDDTKINYQSGARRFGVFQAGDDPAVANAMRRMQAVKAPSSWRDRVYVTNMTPDDRGGMLLDNIESGQVRLRPVNIVSGVAVTYSYVLMNPPQPGAKV